MVDGISNEIDKTMNQIGDALGNKSNQNVRRCIKCGRPIPMDSKFCAYCGYKFEEFIN